MSVHRGGEKPADDSGFRGPDRRGGIRDVEPGLFIKGAETRLAHPASEIQRVRHDCRAKNSAAEIETIAVNDRRRWKITFEDFADGGVRNVGELNTKAHNYGEDKRHDKEFECSYAPHGAIRTVQKEY